ncbi:class I adenylate-forming enzyme family protein [Zavarzinia sp. CC-PAN008]|uniref:class I adenylate-forming enzyme family protein n=1 Tax=Zavarzinia sp. CC-PAN008 TaxID=3243332 RepID=UPI003F743360
MATRAEVIADLTREGTFELTTDHSTGWPRRVYRNAPPALRDIFLGSQAFGDKPFLVFAGETISFAEHYRQVAALASYLHAHGVRKGDRVAIGMRNYPEWAVSFWAVQAIGAISVALNAWWTAAELDYALSHSGSSVLLIDHERLERIQPLLPALKPKAVIVARSPSDDFAGIGFDRVIAGGDGTLPQVEIGPEDLATILYTSGTTGRPKGAMATNRNHVTNIFNTLLNATVARLMAGLPEPGPDAPQPVMLQTFPYFHIAGHTGLYMATATGAKVVLMYKWDPLEAVRLVQEHRISGLAGVPIVMRQLLEAARASGADLSSVLSMGSGGASVPPDLIREIGHRFEAKVSPGNGYGLTETTSAVVANGGQDYLDHPDSVGLPMATADIRVVDDNGNDVPDGTIGEIWCRGPNVIPGYWNNPEATEQAFGGGWFRTGDLGYRSEEGFLYVVDRKKDVIIRGGENVYCAEVEALLLEHPAVRDAALIGLPHDELGEEVAAVIQVDDPAQNERIGPELGRYLAERLARFKIPTRFQVGQGELPRTATGKVLKRELRDLFGGKA